MRRLLTIFNAIMRRLGLARRSRPEDIPKKLDAETLAKALNEARFLSGHGVDVRSLTEDEEPTAPRSADGKEPRVT